MIKRSIVAICATVFCMIMMITCFSACSSLESPSIEEYTAVTTEEELYAMQSGGFYRLENDIDLHGNSWQTKNLGGFDGGGHTISNCIVTGSGFFGDIEYKLSNVKFDSISVIGGVSIAVGDRVGEVQGVTIQNCTLTVTESEYDYFWVGSVAGCVQSSAGRSGNITNCHVKETTIICAQLNGLSYIGGLVGNSFGAGKIMNCSASNVEITANCPNYGRSDNFYVGGLFGVVNNEPISNCMSSNITIDVNSKSVNVGGIVGKIDGKEETITQSVAENNIISVTAESYVRIGGLFGVSEIAVENCYAQGNTLECASKISDSCYIGGLGATAINYITSCYSANNRLIGNVSDEDCFVAGFSPNIREAVRYCAVYENSISGANSDEFSFKSSMLFNCYITDTAETENCNKLDMLSSVDWYSPSTISERLNLDEAVWTFTAGNLPTIVFE